MKKLSLIYILLALLLVIPVAARGGEEPVAEAVGTAEVSQPSDQSEGNGYNESLEELAELPPMHYVLEPEIKTWLGYRYAGVDGSNRAMEYGWPSASAAGGLKLHYTPLPQRLDTELDWNNLYDWNAEFAYAYKDMLKLDYRGWSLWHNLDHMVPQTIGLRSMDLNSNSDYHVVAMDNRVFLRLKWPDRAYHVFAEFRQFERDGTIQQRYYDRSFGSLSRKIAQSRDIDWVTRRYTAGINGHFGPVELEYTHRIKTFDPSGVVRPRYINLTNGVYAPHNVVPEMEDFMDCLRIHTDLTGRVVASAAFATGKKENHYSGATLEFNRACSAVTMIPFEHMTVTVKYKYTDYDEDVPSSVKNPTDPNNPNPLIRRVATTQPIEGRTNSAGVSMRYTPYSFLSVSAEYVFSNVKRNNAALWFDPLFVLQRIPAEQNQHTIKLGFSSRPVKDVSFKGSVTYTYNQDPAYATKALNQVKGKFEAGWLALPSLNAMAYYRFTRGQNNTVNMNAENDNVGVRTEWTPVDRLVLSCGYDWFRYNNDRDGDINKVDGRINYDDMVHLYYLGAGYTFGVPLSVNTEFHQSWSKGGYRTDISGAVGPLTDQKIRETGGSFSAKYDFPKGWGASVSYTINDYQDLQDKPQNGEQDGTAHTVLVMLTKKW